MVWNNENTKPPKPPCFESILNLLWWLSHMSFHCCYRWEIWEGVMSRHGARWSTSIFSFPDPWHKQVVGARCQRSWPADNHDHTSACAHNQQFARKKETEKKRGKRTYHLTQNKSQLCENAGNSWSGNNCELATPWSISLNCTLYVQCWGTWWKRCIMLTLHGNEPTDLQDHLKQIRMDLSHWENWTNLRTIFYVTNWPRDHPLKTTK